jgi:hypothetical protein
MGAVATKIPSGLEGAMAATPLLDGIPERTVRRLAESGVVRQYRRGTYLFHQGDDSPSVLFLWKGRVEISSISVTGHRQLHTTLDQPQFFGELGVLGDMPRTATAIALEESTVWVVPGEDFLMFLSNHPDVARALLAALARQVQAHGPSPRTCCSWTSRAGWPNGSSNWSPRTSISCPPTESSFRRWSPTPTWPACAAGAARTSPGSCRSSSGAGSWSGTIVGTS